MRNVRWSALAMLCAILATLLPWSGRTTNVAASQEGSLQPDVYEPDDGPEQAHPLLPVGLAQRRTFHTGTDVDWVYLDLDAGDRVEITTTGDCDTLLTVYAPDGRTALAQDDDRGGAGNALVRFAAPIESTYFVEIRQFGRSSSPCGPYGVSASFVPPPAPDSFEPDDTSALAKPLPTDGTLQQHSIHAPGDVDWVTITVQANTAFRLATAGQCDTVLTLFGPDRQTMLAEDDDSGQNGTSIIVYTFTQAGTYYLRVRAYDEATDVCDSYSVSATSVPPTFADAFEPDDSAAQARPLPLDGKPQERSLHKPDDLDWVSIFLNAGDRILLWTSGPCDTYLFLVGPDGRTILREDDDSGEEANAVLFFAPREAGLYYAVVRPFGGSSPTCNSYQLQGLTLPSPRTGASPVTSATPVTSGTPTTPNEPTATPVPTRSGFPTATPFRPPTVSPAPTRSTR